MKQEVKYYINFYINRDTTPLISWNLFDIVGQFVFDLPYF